MDLTPLRRRVGLLVLWLLWLLVPIIGSVAWFAGKPVEIAGGAALLAALLTTAVAWRRPGAPLARSTGAAAVMCSISVLVWVAPPDLRLDMHMTYFAALALIAGFCDLRSIVVATVVTAVHHLALDLLLPLAVFPDTQGGMIRVAVHAAILLAEAGALAWFALGIERAAQDAIGDTRLEGERARMADHAADEAARRAIIEQQARAGRHALAEQMDSALGEVAARVGDCAGQIDAAANDLASMARLAAGETGSAANAAATASLQVQTVAAAVEQLSSSISEITRQVTLATTIAKRAVQQARDTDATVSGLADGAQRIGDVVRLISDIAAKTNLLALNATIEAARAGESGRGFAVVAGEVKSLAAQTAKATGEISQQITAIRATTATVVAAVRNFGGVVAEVEQVAEAIAEAVEQQRSAMAESANAASAIAASTSEASTAVAQAASAVDRAAAGVATLEHTSADLTCNGAMLKQRLAAAVTELKAA